MLGDLAGLATREVMTHDEFQLPFRVGKRWKRKPWR